MALKHILPNKVYSASALFEVSEGQPFGWCFPVWKREVLLSGSGLKFVKGESHYNCKYRIKGQDYLDFVNDPDTKLKIPYNTDQNDNN